MNPSSYQDSEHNSKTSLAIDQAVIFIRKHPMASVLSAFALGYVLSKLLYKKSSPSSEKNPL